MRGSCLICCFMVLPVRGFFFAPQQTSAWQVLIQVSHNLGTGKTSTILACARYLYGNNFQSMVLEVRFDCLFHLLPKEDTLTRMGRSVHSVERLRRPRYRRGARADQRLCLHEEDLQVRGSTRRRTKNRPPWPDIISSVPRTVALA